MPGQSRNSAERLSLVVETQREIASAGSDLQAVMRLVAERSVAIIGADGAMVNLIEDGDMMHTRAAVGIGANAFDARRPLSGSVGRYAIESGQPILIEDTVSDPRINQELRARVGDKSLICVPLFQGATVIGTINVLSRSEDDRLTEDDRQIMEMLSVVLSAAVSHAAEFEARRGQAEAFARFRTLFEGASIGILRLCPDGRAVEVNPALEQMLGYTADELAQMTFREYMNKEDLDRAEVLFRDLIGGQRESFQLEARYSRKDGELVWAHVRAALERDQEGEPAFAVTMIENITKRKHAEAELIRQSELNQHQALHDPLTGLPNRVLFGERIEHSINHAERRDTRLAILMMDLNRFKEVNDSLGHQAGDDLLKEVGDRLRGALRASDTVARLGGDEFGLLLPEPSTSDDVLGVVERIRQALERPVYVQDLPLAIEASIGIAVFPDHGREAELLIQRADVAMYAAKQESAPFAFYDPDADEFDPTRLTLVAELRRAMEQRELVLHYQPKAVMEDGSVTSVEALLRWQHPHQGVIYPDAFIPLAQETGLIRPLTLYVVDEALRQCGQWRDEGLGLSVSVNLSMRNLLDLEFPQQVADRLGRWNVPAQLLELEITESTMLANPARTMTVLSELHALGIRLSIDDFGTGYSSLAYLRRLPIDEIKIDRSFVMGMHEQADDVAIVRSTIDLGRNLGLDVVAEGVETEEIWEKLRELGCNTAQGYYLSRPVPAEQLRDWLNEHRAGVPLPVDVAGAVDAPAPLVPPSSEAAA
ncbi:MAG TPA: EAL domain-containing protein [Thermoleophilaceae bacterium]|jgi:diguanylate cyclase (GGDEF)-like protein/PAS domain S-box-containing protein